MNYLRSTSWCMFVLSFVPSLASAGDPSPTEWTRRRAEAGVQKPLEQRDRARGRRFSRARPPPTERRVRVTEAAFTRDERGREFMAFAVDARFADDDEWHENDVLGCAYRETGALFIKRGQAYFPAALLFGKAVDAVPGVCEAAPTRG